MSPFDPFRVGGRQKGTMSPFFYRFSNMRASLSLVISTPKQIYHHSHCILFFDCLLFPGLCIPWILLAGWLGCLLSGVLDSEQIPSPHRSSQTYPGSCPEQNKSQFVFISLKLYFQLLGVHKPQDSRSNGRTSHHKKQMGEIRYKVSSELQHQSFSMFSLFCSFQKIRTGFPKRILLHNEHSQYSNFMLGLLEVA